MDFAEIVTRPEVPDIFVVRAGCLRQVEAEWLVIQPEVFRADPTKGWEPIGGQFHGQHFLGSEELSEVRMHPDDPPTVCAIQSIDEHSIRITNMGGAPLEVVRHLRK